MDAQRCEARIHSSSHLQFAVPQPRKTYVVTTVPGYLHLPVSRVCTSPDARLARSIWCSSSLSSPPLITTEMRGVDHRLPVQSTLAAQQRNDPCPQTDAALVATLLPCANSEWYSTKPRLSVEPFVGLGSGCISSYSRMHFLSTTLFTFYGVLLLSPTKKQKEALLLSPVPY